MAIERQGSDRINGIDKRRKPGGRAPDRHRCHNQHRIRNHIRQLSYPAKGCAAASGAPRLQSAGYAPGSGHSEPKFPRFPGRQKSTQPRLSSTPGAPTAVEAGRFNACGTVGGRRRGWAARDAPARDRRIGPRPDVPGRWPGRCGSDSVH